MEIIVLIAIGLAAGMIAGLLGIGGGLIFTPVLFLLFLDAGVEQPVQWSVASGLLCTLVTAVSSTFRQIIQSNVYWKEGIGLGITGSLGITLGKQILTSSFYDREAFVIFFSAVLFYVAFMMFQRGRDRQKESEREFSPLGIKELLITGGFGGMIAALAGVGGGGVMVPVMNLYFKQPFLKTVSVSHLGMTVLVSTGVLQLALAENQSAGITDLTLGYVDAGAALPLVGGGLVGAYAGAWLTHKINRRYLQWGFTLLAIVMAARLIWSIL